MVNTSILSGVALATLINVVVVTASKKPSSLDTTVWTANDTNLIPEEEIDFDQGSSIAERKKCLATRQCTNAGGSCIKSRANCDGTVNPQGCKGKKCKCCIPNLTTTTTTSPSCPTIPECPTIPDQTTTTTTCPSCPTIPECTTIPECPTIPDQTTTTTTCPSCPTIPECTTIPECPSMPECPTISPSTSTTLSTQGTTTTAECPKGQGYFEQSNQCFKFLADSTSSWNDAKTRCGQLGLVLAKPLNPVQLRNVMVGKFGEKAAWIGARGSGSYVIWESDGTTLSSSDSAWVSGHPGSMISTSYCLEFLSRQYNIDLRPTKPYYMNPCSNRWYPLCELVV